MSTKRPAVLVTGASGFIGLHVVRHLCGTHQVTALDLRPPPKPHPVGVEQIICDLRDGQVPAARFDAIIHLAALGGVRVSIEQPLDCEASNLAATVRLLEHARQHGTPRFIFASSSSVYGPTDGAPSSEDDPLSPCSPYALTKQQGEQWGRLYAQLHGLDFIALRLFAVWGDGQRPDLALESPRRKMLAGETIRVNGNLVSLEGIRGDLRAGVEVVGKIGDKGVRVHLVALPGGDAWERGVALGLHQADPKERRRKKYLYP